MLLKPDGVSDSILSWKEQLSEVRASLKRLKVQTIVVWGFRNPNEHTHHWIHEAFFRSFAEIVGILELSIDVRWHCVSDGYKNFDADRTTLFMSACGYRSSLNYADEGLPLHPKHLYLIHQGWSERAQSYTPLAQQGRCIFFEEYRIARDWPLHPIERLQPDKHTIIFPWATDLMPWEIDNTVKQVYATEEMRQKSKNVSYIGSIWKQNFNEIMQLLQSCGKRGLMLCQKGIFVQPEFFTDSEIYRKYKSNLVLKCDAASVTENRQLVTSSKLAPAIQGKEQLGTYISDRIFKNCSYGALGLTNNPLVHQLMGDCIIYDDDIENVIDRALTVQITRKLEMIQESMRQVVLEHTYLRRIQSMLAILDVNM